MTGPGHAALREAILRVDLGSHDLHDELARTLDDGALDRLTGAHHVRLSPGLGEDADRAAMCLAEEFAKLGARRGARRELDEALGKGETANENDLWRLNRAAEALSGLGRRQVHKPDYEVGPNGAEIRQEEKDALDALIDSIDFRGGRRGRD
jgi:DNA primase